MWHAIFYTMAWVNGVYSPVEMMHHTYTTLPQCVREVQTMAYVYPKNTGCLTLKDPFDAPPPKSEAEKAMDRLCASKYKTAACDTRND